MLKNGWFHGCSAIYTGLFSNIWCSAHETGQRQPGQLCSPPVPAPLGLGVGVIHQLVEHHVQVHVLPVLRQLAHRRPDLLFREPHRGHLVDHVVDGHSGAGRRADRRGADWRSLGQHLSCEKPAIAAASPGRGKGRGRLHSSVATVGWRPGVTIRLGETASTRWFVSSIVRRWWPGVCPDSKGLVHARVWPVERSSGSTRGWNIRGWWAYIWWIALGGRAIWCWFFGLLGHRGWKRS